MLGLLIIQFVLGLNVVGADLVGLWRINNLPVYLLKGRDSSVLRDGLRLRVQVLFFSRKGVLINLS